MRQRKESEQRERKPLSSMRRGQCRGQKTGPILQSCAGTMFRRPWKGSGVKGKGRSSRMWQRLPLSPAKIHSPPFLPIKADWGASMCQDKTYISCLLCRQEWIRRGKQVDEWKSFLQKTKADSVNRGALLSFFPPFLPRISPPFSCLESLWDDWCFSSHLAPWGGHKNEDKAHECQSKG